MFPPNHSGRVFGHGLFFLHCKKCDAAKIPDFQRFLGLEVVRWAISAVTKWPLHQDLIHPAVKFEANIPYAADVLKAHLFMEFDGLQVL